MIYLSSPLGGSDFRVTKAYIPDAGPLAIIIAFLLPFPTLTWYHRPNAHVNEEPPD